MAVIDGGVPPILAQMHYTRPSAFTPDVVARNLMTVEMKAAALYAFAQARHKPVQCFTHVTNQMGRVDGDFEKGEADGSHDALRLIAIAADRLRSRRLP